MPPDGRAFNDLDSLRRFDTCTIANAIERLQARPRNEGFIYGGAICRFPHYPPMVGHAVTGRIETYMPPITGKCYYDHIEWWRYLMTIPPPRTVVLQDVDKRPGFGALFGEMHARICRAFDCIGYVTNGAVRDLEGIESTALQVFAGSLSVSHSYAHIIDFGGPVEIGGLRIKPGDILHGDRHGLLSIPKELVEKLPSAAEEILSEEKELIALTSQPNFSVDMLGARLRQFAEKQRCT